MSDQSDNLVIDKGWWWWSMTKKELKGPGALVLMWQTKLQRQDCKGFGFIENKKLEHEK